MVRKSWFCVASVNELNYLDGCIADIKLDDQTSICGYGLGNIDIKHGPLVSYRLGRAGDVQVTLLGGNDWTVGVGSVVKDASKRHPSCNRETNNTLLWV